MIKLLLINPEISSQHSPEVEYFVPSSMMSLATSTKNAGAIVEILDLNVIKYKRNTKLLKTIISKIEQFNPDIIGIGCMFTGQFKSILRYSKEIKKINPNKKIVIGGMHPTLFYKEILKNSTSIDIIVTGEGELALIDILKYLKNEIPLSEVPSIAYKKDNEIIVNKQKRVLDLNSLPQIDYSFVDIKNYYDPRTVNWHNPKNLPINATLPIFTSRGCPMDCNFCCLHEIMAKKMRYRDPKKVVDEMELLITKYNHTHFSFWDDNLVINKKHILKVCDEIIKRNLNIQFETPNGVAVRAMDAEILDALCSAGMTRLSMSIEHGSDFIRNKIIKKRLSEEKIYEIADLTKKYDKLQVRAFFIIGFPEETPETLEDTFKMIKRIDVDKPIVNNLMPYAGTELFKQCLLDNLFIDKIKFKEMWKFGDLHFAGNRDFYIKPYKMSIDELSDYRTKFDEFISKHIEMVKRKRNYISL